MRPLLFPAPSSGMQSASFLQLVRQGLWLHYASFVGPLRTSPEFRLATPRWRQQVATRWWREYGLNVTLFVVMQPLIFMYAALPWVWEVVTLMMLPFMTVAQMMVDSFKPSVRVFYDERSRTGLTVRAYMGGDGQLTWAYYNHYALPVGRRVGVGIRCSLHAAAAATKVRLVCYAQSDVVASHYEREPHAVPARRLDATKPFLLWEYSDRKDAPFSMVMPQTKRWSLGSVFGVHNIRNSGAAPLVVA